MRTKFQALSITHVPCRLRPHRGSKSTSQQSKLVSTSFQKGQWRGGGGIRRAARRFDRVSAISIDMPRRSYWIEIPDLSLFPQNSAVTYCQQEDSRDSNRFNETKPDPASPAQPKHLFKLDSTSLPFILNPGVLSCWVLLHSPLFCAEKSYQSRSDLLGSWISISFWSKAATPQFELKSFSN